ncbi:MAG: toll/interleukin-1 receptor domain-containing protein [Cyanobacteria bacterium J06627_8]
MGQSGTIFISYRRSDSAAEAGRIYDKLAITFGPDSIFKDVDNIPYGVDFVEHLSQAVSQCDVVLVLIGHTWLDSTDANHQHRLDDPHDFVRLEVASALTRDILVVPVLLNSVSMPTADQLPDNLKHLTRRNAVQVRQDPDFHRDMERLIANLENYFNDHQKDSTVTNTPGKAQGKANLDISASKKHDTIKATSLSPKRPVPYLSIGLGIILLLGLAIIAFQFLSEPPPEPSQPSQSDPQHPPDSEGQHPPDSDAQQKPPPRR